MADAGTGSKQSGVPGLLGSSPGSTSFGGGSSKGKGKGRSKRKAKPSPALEPGPQPAGSGKFAGSSTKGSDRPTISGRKRSTAPPDLADRRLASANKNLDAFIRQMQPGGDLAPRRPAPAPPAASGREIDGAGAAAARAGYRPASVPAPEEEAAPPPVDLAAILEMLLGKAGPAPDRASYTTPFDVASKEVGRQYDAGAAQPAGMPPQVAAQFMELRNDSTARMDQQRAAQQQALAASQAQAQAQRAASQSQIANMGGDVSQMASAGQFADSLAQQSQAASQAMQANMAAQAAANSAAAEQSAMAGVSTAGANLQTNRATADGRIATGRAGAEAQYGQDVQKFEAGEAARRGAMLDRVTALMTEGRKARERDDAADASNPDPLTALEGRDDQGAVDARATLQAAIDGTGPSLDAALLQAKAGRMRWSEKGPDGEKPVVDAETRAAADEYIKILENARRWKPKARKPSKLDDASEDDRTLIGLLQQLGLG